MKGKGESQINKSSVLKKLIPVLVIVAGFLLISEYLQNNENSNSKSDDKDFNIVDTYEEVKFYEREHREYGSDILRKADHYDLIQTFEDKMIPVLESNRTLQIHEVWNNDREIYLLYSVDISLLDHNPDDVPYLEVEKLILNPGTEKEVEVGAELFNTRSMVNHDRYANDGLVYEDRLYRSIWIRPELYDAYKEVISWSPESGDDHEAFENNIENIENVTISQLHLVDRNQKHKIEEIPLKMSFSKKEETLETIVIDETLALDEENEVQFKRLEVYLHQDRLYLDVKPDSKRFYKYAYTLNGREFTSELLYDEKGEAFLPAGNVHDQVSIQLNFEGAMVPTDEELEFEITQEDITKLKNQQTTDSTFLDLQREIGTLPSGRSLQLDGIDFENENEDYIKILLTMESDQNDFGSLSFNDYTQFLERKEHNLEVEDMNSEAYIEVKDNEGERIRLLGIGGQFQDKKSRFEIHMMKDDFLSSDGLSFRLFHFSKPVEFDAKEIVIPLDED